MLTYIISDNNLFWFSHVIFLTVIFINTFDCIQSYPAKDRLSLSSIEVPPPEIIHYMRRFGYLETNPSDAEALYHESAIRKAIKNVQKFGALNQTGELDRETMALFTTPRCGVPDITTESFSSLRTKRYIIGAKSWQKRTIRYFIANWSSKIERKKIELDLERAFEMWSRYNRLKFQRSYTTAADIIIGFGSQYHGDSYPFDGPGNILAHAFYPYEMGSYGGDIHFDEDENWKENSTDLSDGVDFYSVALHELGHSLGLAHSPVYSSIMFPYYKGPGHNILDYDDVLAMYQMYVQKLPEIDDDLEVQTTSTINFNTVTLTPIENITTTNYENKKFTTQTVTEHTHEVPKRKTDANFLLNICHGYFDAVSMIQGSVYIFKGQYVWKLTKQYKIANGFPKKWKELYSFFPEEIKCIDALYERHDGMTIFFTGTLYWVYDGIRLQENSPKNLTFFTPGLVNLTKVDAVMVWPKNNLTYIFGGNQFWKINELKRTFEDNNPKPMQRWVGIPSHIDAAATLANGNTYFFKDNLYWLYNNRYIRPERGYPRRASRAWLHCPLFKKTKLRNTNTTIIFI